MKKNETARSLAIAGFALAMTIGCAVKSPGSIVSDHMLHDGIRRNYIIFLPSDLHPGMPLVLNLHGYGSDAVQQMNYSAMNSVADTAGFIVVYPNAMENRWNSGISDSPRWPVPGVDDVSFIEALIDTMHVNYEIDLHRVFSCGMSNGGFMSFKLACELSQRISAAASVTGVISEGTALDCDPQRRIPILHIHGTHDRTVPYDGTFGWYGVKETANHWAGLFGCVPSDITNMEDMDQTDGSTVSRITYSDSAGRDMVTLYVVSGGGHTWPGSAYDLPGITNRDINASEVIWDFFSNQDHF